ncbi:tRNA(Ile)-lysidine synthase [Saonia flava]|uniref:tRNA(Ile)-lysidine synthase n=1 Tax=Saonia flava TaxID=523696 RepID=A0A846QYA2_9FLAO|nr:tRNA lysidine(34) synthetase TilS [Saonia flava]NJB70094.1 tRNA(Ile)-lysidine synthase [Saonia flava]
MLKEFHLHIKNHFPELKNTVFLLACSGGLDSVVLAHLFAKLNLQYALAHCNFNLRGKESNGDEKFVESLAIELKKECFVTSFNTKEYISKNKVSLQVAARELRYNWFAKVMEKNGIEKLVTAHHADDNLETFLINLSRGTGIDGLTGIPAKTDTISRPLLRFSREQILEYANSEKLKWREDSTNKEIKYVRNKIRHQIVPLLKELNPTFLANFIKTQDYLKQSSILAEDYLEQVKEKLLKKEGDIVKIEIAELKKCVPLNAYLYGLFKEYGFTEWDDVAGLLVGESGKEVFSKTHRLLKNREYLLLQNLNTEVNQRYQIDSDRIDLKVPFHMSISEVKTMTKTSGTTLYVDEETLKYPLTIRKWEKGDYFYPIGMKGQKKKVSKFFKDEKMSLIEKEKQWILCSENNIVWIIGKRADERYKISNKTKSILKFSVL